MIAHNSMAANLKTSNGTLFLNVLATCSSWTCVAEWNRVGLCFLLYFFDAVYSLVLSGSRAVSSSYASREVRFEKSESLEQDAVWERSVRGRVKGSR